MASHQPSLKENAALGIISQLLALYNPHEDEIESWFAQRHAIAPPHFYTSVDLRHSGHKIVPVDTNLFPAGFNNLSAAAMARAVEKVKEYLRKQFPPAQSVLLIPENHTRNMGYLENLVALQTIFEKAGVKIELGSLAAEGRSIILETPSGQVIRQSPVKRVGHYIETAEGFRPDLVVVNNDFTSGAPEILCGLKQPVAPSPGMGWYRRFKSVHFAAYDQLLRDFTQRFAIDPWLISTLFARCGVINFQEPGGIECVATNVEKVLHAIRRKYEEYGIKDEPYVFIKADSGTYGMGIMTVRSADELLQINKKTRNKMKVIKEGALNTEVIIQEGVPTIDSIEGNPAEPMIYLIDGTPIGGAFRVNEQRDAFGNLNAQGMRFTGMCDEEENETAKEKVQVASCNFKVYGLMSRLAAYAAALENYEPSYSI